MDERRTEATARHDRQRAERDLREQPEAGTITPQYLTACVRDALAGEDALFLSEAITNYEVVAEHLRKPTRLADRQRRRLARLGRRGSGRR